MKKIKIQIVSWFNGSVLFEYEVEDNTIKKTVEEAVNKEADLRRANLQEADLWGANLRGANLRGADLRGANLREANLRRADLWEADLWGADLRGANLRRADLRRADLWEADLRGADLWGANLRGADLWEADLWGANLRGADLRGADLREAKRLKMYWHLHHEILVENLTEPLKNRIAYIKKEKPKEEAALRLKLLKKVKAKVFPKTQEGWEKLHKKECKNCSWDGKSIFRTRS